MADREGFDPNFDYDSSILPTNGPFWGELVADNGQHQARTWFLVGIETYKPTGGLFSPNVMIRELRDGVLPIYCYALTRWLERNADVPKYKTGIPWLEERGSPIFADLWDGIEKWARTYKLTIENRPAEWILAAADANLTLWADGSFYANPQWLCLDRFETGRLKIKGERLEVFYNPESMRAEDAHADLDRQIQDIHGRAEKLGARSTSGMVKRPSSRRFYDETGEILEIPQHVEWFVRRQVCGDSLDTLAHELPSTYEEPNKAIQTACRSFAKLIGLTPRRDKPGPKGKHLKLGK
jgi:hypothetical protein